MTMLLAGNGAFDAGFLRDRRSVTPVWKWERVAVTTGASMRNWARRTRSKRDRAKVSTHMALTRRYMTRTAQSASINWSILRTPEGHGPRREPMQKHDDAGATVHWHRGLEVVGSRATGAGERRSLGAGAAFQRSVAVAFIGIRLPWSPCPGGWQLKSDESVGSYCPVCCVNFGGVYV